MGLGFFWPFRRAAEVLRLPGVVEVQEVRLGSKVGGRVARVAVREGDLVEEGQELVVFDVPELKAQYAQWAARLEAAEAQLLKAENGPRPEEKDAARAAVAAAQARLERLKAGWREEEKRQARNELASAKADLALAQREFARVEQLYRQGTASRSESDLALAARERAQGRTDAAQARLDMLEAGSRKEDIAEAEAELKRVEANYRLLLAGTRPEEIAEAQAQVAETRGKLREIEANLAEAVLRAPEEAVVEVLAVRKGDLVAPNQPVVRVLRADDLWVKIYVPETELGKVRLNQPVQVAIDSYADRRFAGTIIQIAGISEFTPRNVQSPDERRHQVFGVKVHVDNPEGIFKSGMAAEVFVPLAN